MQCVFTTMLVLRDLASLAVDGEGAVLDAVRFHSQLPDTACGPKIRLDGLPVGITPNNRPEVGVIGLGVGQVLRAVVITENDVLEVAVLVFHVEVRDAGAVWNERSIDAIGAQGVLLEWIAGERRKGRATGTIIARRVLCGGEGGCCQEQRACEGTHVGYHCLWYPMRGSNALRVCKVKQREDPRGTKELTATWTVL